MAIKKKARQASRPAQACPTEEWSCGHTLSEWADYLDTTCTEAVEKFKRWECRGWCEVARADNGRVFLRVTQRGVAIGDRITGAVALCVH